MRTITSIFCDVMARWLVTEDLSQSDCNFTKEALTEFGVNTRVNQVSFAGFCCCC